jgi:hypothetical protein
MWARRSHSVSLKYSKTWREVSKMWCFELLLGWSLHAKPLIKKLNVLTCASLLVHVNPHVLG